MNNLLNKSQKEFLDKLISLGLIKNYNDLIGNEKPTFLFDYMVKNYSYLLDNEIDVVFTKKEFENGELFHKLVIALGKYFLKNPQIIEDKEKLLNGDNEIFNNEKLNILDNLSNEEEPVIFLSNHRFRDDALGTILAIKKRAYVVFGSLPQFYNTIDGIVVKKNGVIIVNRKIKDSKKMLVDKSKFVLENGKSVIIYPEGVWNKSPNDLMLNFWSGFYRVAKKEDGTFYKIVPVIHYIRNPHEYNPKNTIHTVVDNPIDMTGLNEKEAVDLIRNRMITWYYKLMETYGTTTREELIKDACNSTEAYDIELTKRLKTADRYDKEIEICSDKNNYDNPIDIWEPIANLKPDKNNAIDVCFAKNKVKELKMNDFQHRY